MNRLEFRKEVRERLSKIPPAILRWEEAEFWMIQTPYEIVEYFAEDNRLLNTAIALPVARGLHNGAYRKSRLVKDGQVYRVPYVIHPLTVCRMLIEMRIQLPPEELDILLAAALCHDLIEDVPFPKRGRELVEDCGLDERVYETVRKVSKRKDFTEEQERAFFAAIARDPLALLVKLADRSNNVEDLYNRPVWKVHEYVQETRRLFLPMCHSGWRDYPYLQPPIELLADKIAALVNTAEAMVDTFSRKERQMNAQLEELRAENAALRQKWKLLRSRTEAAE